MLGGCHGGRVHNGNFSYTVRECDECWMSRKRRATCKFDAFVLRYAVRASHNETGYITYKMKEEAEQLFF